MPTIYTRSGDSGMTSLFGGRNVPKSDNLVNAYGSLDELNSWIGLVAAHFPSTEVNGFFLTIQKDLLSLSAYLAGAPQELAFIPGRVKEMEARIDEMQKQLPELNKFILPGGSRVGAFLHVVRSVCRRAERAAVVISVDTAIDRSVVMYLNRLSDLFFVLARYMNMHEHAEEVQWEGKRTK